MRGGVLFSLIFSRSENIVNQTASAGSATLTINPNGGTWTGGNWGSRTAAQSFTQASNSTKSIVAPTRPGYTFVGWQAVNANSGDKISTMGKSERNYAFATSTEITGGYQGGVYSLRNTSLLHSPYNTSTIVVTHPSGSNGGFSFHTLSYAGAEFYVVLNMKMPVGSYMQHATNQVGGPNGDYSSAGAAWLTPHAGTGEWETYVHYIKAWPAGQSGAFYSTTNFFYFEGVSTSSEVEIASAQVYDATGMGINYSTFMQDITKTMTYTFGTGDQTLVALWQEDSWLKYADTNWEGKGTVSEPYLIDTAEKLAGVSYRTKYDRCAEGTYFKQTANINLGGHNWYPVGKHGYEYYFYNHYDGNGYTISGMYINAQRGVVGLFGDVSYGSVKNVTLKDSRVYVSGNDCHSVGSVVGILDNGATMVNCHSDATVIVEGGNARIGGLVGWNWYDEIRDCTFSGTVEGSYQVGGIVGKSTGGSVVNCINTGRVVATGDSAGGIIGMVEQTDRTTTVSGCISYGDIESLSYAASIVGNYGGGTIENCAGFGQIIATGGDTAYFGAIVGYRSGTITIKNCSFVGTTNVYGCFYDLVSYMPDVATLSIDSCYSIVNGEGTYTTGTFEGFGLVTDMNDDLPMQKTLYAVAQFGDGVSASWFSSNGFKKV